MGISERISAQSAPRLFDVVELLVDRPAAGLTAGALGTIVEELRQDVYLVEFSDESGRAIALEALKPRDFGVVR